jgi:hypothetical protein
LHKTPFRTRQYFITGADDYTQAITARNPELLVTQHLAEHPSELLFARFLTEDATEFSLSWYLAEDAMPSEHLVPKTTLLIFPADTAAATVLQKINPDAPFYSEMLQYANVSLERANGLMKSAIEREGDLDIKKASTLCKPTTRSTLDEPSTLLGRVSF